MRKIEDTERNAYHVARLHQQIALPFLLSQISKEGDEFTVSVEVANVSKLVADAIADSEDDVIEVRLPNVKASILAKVIEYCEHYQQDVMTDITTPLKSSKIEDLVQQWYADYINIEQTMLFEMVTTANFMDIKPLLDLTCLAVSILIKGKTPEELRRIFGISDNFTPDEEAQIRAENNW
eukprot:CAMPEP_0202445092 /NCGR_PEP_ID=MMETSP1360-20130828/3980_1 /ASSEMBLY_ACC=CAM_ASM_000848 /TAXON_ID=515479 /ORGANISM="Licmophora paradoxa, Strain CCMP2313" /LENGTH=179 /DNA_ID=CAMNT_0049061243 /DNA_START=278 /DNA_END=815 /DNA_ORIENTATION=+